MELVADYRCDTGEGPLYDPARDAVFWTDIPKGRLFRLDCATRQHRQIYASEPVGGFTLEDDGALILFRVKDVARFDPETAELRVLAPFKEEGIPRFNDTSAGPGPSRVIYAGTMGEKNVMGGLFRVTREAGAVKFARVQTGTGCANGMGWSPDLRLMYWTCSSRNRIFVYDYDAATGEMRNERVFHQANHATDGTCDGLAVDSAGNVYSARWGGSAIHKFSPQGELVAKIPVPTANVTSLCFGGKDLRDVYVSTAAAGKETPGAGGLYFFRNDVPGQLEYRSRLAVG